MGDLKHYIKERKNIDKEFAKGYDEGYADLKIGIMLRHLREEAKLTQEELALALNTKKSAISRIENHAEDMRLSTLLKIVSVLGKKINIQIS